MWGKQVKEIKIRLSRRVPGYAGTCPSPSRSVPCIVHLKLLFICLLLEREGEGTGGEWGTGRDTQTCTECEADTGPDVAAPRPRVTWPRPGVRRLPD